MTEWRFLDTGPCTASLNMALDEAIALHVQEGNSPPTLRIYEWIKPSVSIGCFQKIVSVNLPYCLERDIPVVRRITGGRAILHDHELTYSFSAQTSDGPFSKGLMDSYRKISEAFCLAILKLGLSPEARTDKDHDRGEVHLRTPLCFDSASFAEITLNGRKVVGSAQKRWKGGLLQQGSIPYALDEEAVKRVFTMDASADIRERMIGLREAVHDLTHEFFKETIRVSFEETFGVKFIRSGLSPAEHRLAFELESQRYLSPEWNLQR